MITKWITELQAIGQTGLTFSTDEFDRQRYTRLIELASEMTSSVFELPNKHVKSLFLSESGYATPKMDARAVVFDNQQLLLARERSDDKWTLPGGWIDVNESASECIIRETFEETGYKVEVVKLLALWDKQKHDHPPQWPHAHKCFFECRIIGGTATANLEISEIAFFDLSELPVLSENRVTESQIRKLAKLILPNPMTDFD